MPASGVAYVGQQIIAGSLPISGLPFYFDIKTKDIVFLMLYYCFISISIRIG